MTLNDLDTSEHMGDTVTASQYELLNRALDVSSDSSDSSVSNIGRLEAANGEGRVNVNRQVHFADTRYGGPFIDL